MTTIQAFVDFLSDNGRYRPIIVFALLIYIYICFILHRTVWSSTSTKVVNSKKKPSEPFEDGTFLGENSPFKEPSVGPEISEREFGSPILTSLTLNSTEDTIAVSMESCIESKIKFIGYTPNAIFRQDYPYQYPVVIMPTSKCVISFPRRGRSNKLGYTEPAFYANLKEHFGSAFVILNTHHILSKSIHRPYEPDFVLYTEDHDKNIYINVEIDEPYEGLTRAPTHILGRDDYRDNYLLSRGYIVIRFTEQQVHEQPLACCNHITAVIISIDADFPLEIKAMTLSSSPQWDSFQAKKWARERYRENYLGISSFGERNVEEFEYQEVDLILHEEIESLVIERQFKVPRSNRGKLERRNSHERDDRIKFIPSTHQYLIDGNPDTISVSQLVDRFFPEFDAINASQTLNAMHAMFGLEPEEVRLLWQQNGEEQAQLGSQLHSQIENYYNDLPYEASSREFQYFLNFTERYSAMERYRTEWRIFDEELVIAGTIDMIYRRPKDDKLIMFDWKRSKKVVDATGKPLCSDPNNPYTEFAFGELSHLTNDSYVKYCLQQNLYRHILEARYGVEISSMNLLILHPEYEKYYIATVPRMHEEVQYVLSASRYV